MAIAIFCALEIEARLFIDTYRLKKTIQMNHFKIFSSEEIYVMITGIGEKNVRIGIGLFKGLFPNFAGNLLNFGCAGHQTFPLGSLFISHVVEDELGERFYLNPSLNLQIPFFPTKTVHQVEKNYFETALKEMEAYYFVDSALAFFTIDQLHILKIISDNAENSFELLNKETLLKLCYSQKESLIKVVTALLSSSTDPATKIIENLKEKFHLTETKSHALKRLLERAIALNLSTDFSAYNDLSLFESALKEQIAGSFVL